MRSNALTAADLGAMSYGYNAYMKVRDFELAQVA